MPRSSGGGIGSFSSASSRPNAKRNVASAVALSAVSKDIERFTGDSNSCLVVFDRYEECVETEHLHGAGTCDFLRELRESCSRFKRDPRQWSVYEGQQQWEESTQRKATAAGFATIGEYMIDKYSNDPAMCRIAYGLYKECVSRNPSDRACNSYRLNNCRQFRS